MALMRCYRCGHRTVDLDTDLEDWDEAHDCCRWCSEQDEAEEAVMRRNEQETGERR